MKKIVLISLLLTASALPIISQTTKPNIIYILADDLGYGDLGCYGQQFIETPNIDQLAEGGIKFLRHYAGSTVCAPSRASLLTGLHTGNSPIRGNKERFPHGQFPLSDSTVTVETMLKENGYHTKLIGKWGLGYTHTTGDPIKQGFESFFGYNCQRRAHRYHPRKLWVDEKRVPMKGRPYSHDLFTQKALDYIADQKDSAFFLYLAYTIPHARIDIPKDRTHYYAEKIKTDSTLSQWGRRKSKTIVKYASMVALMDHDIGRIMSRLDSLGLLENTIVFFASDNGPQTEGGMNPAFLNSSGNLRGKKRDLYEGGIRIPFIVSWDGVIKPGSVSNHVSAFWDFFPTVDDILQISNPPKTDGISFLPTLLNSGNQKIHDFLYWENHGKGGKQAVLYHDWKLILNGVNTSHPTQELYNLSNDPSESHNVAASQDELLEKLKEIIKSAHKRDPIFKFKYER